MEVLYGSNVALPYSSSDDLIRLLLRHYLPLLDTTFLNLYEQLGFYSGDLRFVVNGQVIEPSDIATSFALERVKRFVPQKAEKRFGYGILGLSPNEYPIESDLCGVILCTHGKVIKSDFFNQFPGSLGPRIFGLAEIPGLIDFLTTAKTDFIRRKRLREFERLYDPVRQEFKAWLTDLGIESQEISGSDEAAKLERELKKLLDDVPELSDFFGFRTKKPILQPSANGPIITTTEEGIEPTFPVGEGEAGEGLGLVDSGDQPGEALIEDQKSGSQKARPVSRTARRGPKITFNRAPDRVDLAWIEGSNIVINSGHPAYIKICSNTTATRLHNLFSIASAIQRYLVSEGVSQDLTFTDRMMVAWGKK